MGCGALRCAGRARCCDAGWPSLALLGGPAEEALAAEIGRLAAMPRASLPAIGWRLTEAAALLAEASFYVGNNTGVMNMAAAVGIPTYALFGTTPVFAPQPADHPDRLAARCGAGDGMARVSLEAVLAIIERDRGSLGPDANGAGQ